MQETDGLYFLSVQILCDLADQAGRIDRGLVFLHHGRRSSAHILLCLPQSTVAAIGRTACSRIGSRPCSTRPPPRQAHSHRVQNRRCIGHRSLRRHSSARLPVRFLHATNGTARARRAPSGPAGDEALLADVVAPLASPAVDRHAARRGRAGDPGSLAPRPVAGRDRHRGQLGVAERADHRAAARARAMIRYARSCLPPCQFTGGRIVATGSASLLSGAFR